METIRKEIVAGADCKRPDEADGSNVFTEQREAGYWLRRLLRDARGFCEAIMANYRLVEPPPAWGLARVRADSAAASDRQPEDTESDAPDPAGANQQRKALLIYLGLAERDMTEDDRAQLRLALGIENAGKPGAGPDPVADVRPDAGKDHADAGAGEALDSLEAFEAAMRRWLAQIENPPRDSAEHNLSGRTSASGILPYQESPCLDIPARNFPDLRDGERKDSVDSNGRDAAGRNDDRGNAAGACDACGSAAGVDAADDGILRFGGTYPDRKRNKGTVHFRNIDGRVVAIKGDDPAGGRSQARANGSSADNHNVASEQDAREQDGKREKTNAVGENKGDARPHTRPGDEQGANSQGAPESEKLTDKEARRLKEIESDLEAGRELTDEQKRFLGEFSAKHGREIQAALKGTLLQRLFLGMSPDDADDTTDTGLDAAYQQRLQRAFQTNRDNPLMGDPTGTAWHFGGLAGGLAGAAEAGMSLEGYYESIRSGESASVAGIFLKSVPIGAFMAAKGIVDAMAHLPTTVRSVGRLGAMALDGGLGEILNMQLKAVLNADPEDQAQMLGEFIGQWGMGELIANPGNAKWLGDRLKMLGQAAGGNLKDKAVALAKGAPDAWSAAICMRHGGMTMKEITAELLRNPNNYCFIEETPVHTPQGIVPIENLNAGDHVKSCVVTDHPGSTAHAAIGETSEGVVAEVIALVFPDEAILCTPAHPFFVLGKGWTEAADMRPGDRIPDVEGRPVSLKSSETRSGKFRVFNFTTPGLGTYFVGNSGLLVHNGGMACSVKHVQDFAKNVGIFEDLTNEQVDMFRSAYAMYDEAKQRFNKPWLDRPALRDDFVRAGHLLADDVVHHKIPLEVLWKFPGVFKPGEINSWNNFMGMQKKVHVAFSGYWREAIPRIWKMLKDDGVKLDQPEFAHKARIYIEAARDLVTPENAAILKDDSSLFVDGLRKQAAGRQPFP